MANYWMSLNYLRKNKYTKLLNCRNKEVHQTDYYMSNLACSSEETKYCSPRADGRMIVKLPGKEEELLLKAVID